MKFTNKKPLIELSATISSAVLLALAYPPVASGDLAFFALVPLMALLRNADCKRGFRLGYIFGFIFNLINLSWLIALKDNGGPLALVAVGLIFLSAYCALYTALFGLASSWLWKMAKKPHIPAPWIFISFAWICEPLLYAGSEYLRATILTGFPWNPLAATQYKNLPLLSAVSLFGESTLTFVIVIINSGITSLILRLYLKISKTLTSSQLRAPNSELPNRFPYSFPLAVAIVVLTAVWWRGIDKVREAEKISAEAPKFKLAMIHPDAPCIFEKYGDASDKANEDLITYTTIASAVKPDVTFWPETVLPGYAAYDATAAEMVSKTLNLTKTPLIAGGCDFKYTDKENNEGVIFNSAFLFDKVPDAKLPSIVGVYNKQHLVPFGEFIPLESKIPILKNFAPTGFSCEAGNRQVYFTIQSKQFRNAAGSCETNSVAGQIVLAPLICFEDAFPYLTRNAASGGADALVVLVNDAWFDGTALAEQHLAQSVLRAAESGLPVIRATNAGVTSFIMANGRIAERIGDGTGSGTPGFITTVQGIPSRPKPTLYTKYGDIFLAKPAAGLLVGILFAAGLTRKKRTA